MNTYLQELAKSSEVDGKATAYTNFIATQGAEYITATKLSMMQERQRRERAKLANSHVNKNLEQTDAAYELGKGLNFEKFDLALPASVDRNTDLENANIFQQGSATAHSSQMRESFASGVLDNILGNSTRLQRAKIIDAIERGDTSKLYGATKETVERVLGFVDSSNRNGVLSSAKAARSSLDSIEATEDAVRNQQIQDSRIGVLDGFNKDGDALASQNFNSILDFYNNEDYKGLEQGIVTSVNKTNEEIFQINSTSDELLSGTAKENLTRDARESILAPLLAIAARDGNVDQLNLAITRKDKNALGNLTEFQASIVEAIQAENFPYLPDDNTFISTFLSGSVNQVKQRADDYIAVSEFENRITEFVKDNQAGTSTSDTYDGLVDETNKNPLLTGPAKDAIKNRLKTGLAYGEINKFPNPSSSSLNILQQYIASEGSNDLGLTEEQKASADAILKNVDANNLERVVGNIGTRQANFRTNELEAEEKLKAIQRQQKLATEALSGGTAKTKQHREHIDAEVLPRMELSIFNPDSQTEELYGVLRNTMSQQLIDTLKGLASGTQNYDEGTANLMLNHFARLRYDMAVSGTINRFGDLLTGKEYGILEDALAIRNLATGTTEPIGTIINRLKTAAISDVAQKQYDEIFAADKVKNSGNTPAYDYVYGLVKDTRMALELEPIAEYYAKTGRNKTQIKQMLNDVIDNNYAASQYIVDPSMPPSMMGKSRHALSIFYPDPDERTEFIRQVQAALPNDFELADITGVKASEAQGMERVVGEIATGEAAIAAGEKTRAFLVPFGPSNEPQYYVYYQDNETKELRPLIYNKPTYDPRTSQVVDELTWPMFDGSTTEAWRQRKLLENQQKAAEKVEDSRALFETLRESSKRRGYQ